MTAHDALERHTALSKAHDPSIVLAVILGVAHTSGSRTPDRRSHLAAATAIVVGLLLGALTCTGASGATAAAQQPSAISADDVHEHPAEHPAEHTDGHGTAGQHHVNMACLVDITLRIADLDVVIVSQPTAGSESCSAISRFFGPEPPVPRTSS